MMQSKQENRFFEKTDDHANKCPYPNCRFFGNIEALGAHLTIHFESTCPNVDEYIKKRQKNFTFPKRVELKKAELIKRWSRGERAGIKLIKKRENGEVNIRVEKSRERYPKFPKNNRARKRPQHILPIVYNEESLDSDEDCKNGINAFKGFKLNEILTVETEIQIEDNFCISDEDDYVDKSNDKPTNFASALGALCAYDDSEDEPSNEDNVGKVNSAVVEESKSVANDKNENEGIFNKGGNTKYQTFKRKFNHKNNSGAKRRRHSLLEKFLHPEVMHERNTILQSLHYIVENNFFDD